MIVFDLTCPLSHRFEGWFASSKAFAEQSGRGLVECPQCGSVDIAKAPMAPAVPAKGNARTEPAAPRHPVAGGLPPKVAQALHELAKAQANALKDSTFVGDKFAEECRAMHYGERDQALIHGQATRDEAEALVDEGIAVSPLPLPVEPPETLN